MNQTIYNNWNFETHEIFDEFWFDDKNNFKIFNAADHVVGKESIEVSRIGVAPEKNIYKG